MPRMTPQARHYVSLGQRMRFGTPFDVEREKVKKILANTGLFESGKCWLWTGRKINNGYGQLRWNGYHVAHRFVYETFVAKIPDGMLACHTCDVRNCVNPEHIFLGTVADNSKDMVVKGRDHGRIEPWMVRKIRAGGHNDCEFARMFGVKPQSVRAVRIGLTRKHIQ